MSLEILDPEGAKRHEGYCSPESCRNDSDIQRIKREKNRVSWRVFYFSRQNMQNMQTIAIVSLLDFVKIKISNKNVLQDGFLIKLCKGVIEKKTKFGQITCLILNLITQKFWV